MSSQINLKIVAKDGIKFKGNAEIITVPSISGEITILANHIPILSGLKIGVIKITDENQKVSTIQIESGFLRLINNVCIITIEESSLKKAS